MFKNRNTLYAYVAGIIDGEGSISLTRNHNCKEFRYPSIHVPSTSYELMDLLKKEFGGWICTKKLYKENHKQSWSWSLSYNNAIQFLEKIHKYLVIKEKRRRANLIIQRYKEVTPRNGQYTPELYKAKKAFEKEFHKNGGAEGTPT